MSALDSVWRVAYEEACWREREREREGSVLKTHPQDDEIPAM